MAAKSAAGLLTSVDSMFTTQEERDNAQRSYVIDLPATKISDFPDHPFKVRMDEEMEQMAESVRERGVLSPMLVRPMPDSSYQMVSGREFCVDELCRILEVSRSGYYAWRKRGISIQKQRNQELTRELVWLNEAYPALGLDGLYHMIKPAIPCSRVHIHRLMKRLNIHSARKKACKSTTNSKHSYSVAPNLINRQFHFERPNQAWVGDITYIPTDKGWLYLAMVKDLCTRRIIGYAFSERIDTQLTLDAQNMAVRRERPQPEALGIRQSMSHKGDPYDNAVSENFFSCLKAELIHLRRFACRFDLAG